MTTISEEQAHYRYERAQLRRRHEVSKIQRSNNQSWSTNSPAFIIGLSLVLMGVIAFFAALIHMTSKSTSGGIGIIVADAFSPRTNLFHKQHYKSSTASTTRIFLEDWVADMIDEEIYRQYHHKEYEEAWMKKNKAAILSRLSDASSNDDSSSSSSSSGYPSSMMMLEGEDREAFAEHKRDERMAFLKPEKYCADRCLATGNCDIFEDFYELGPEDVLRFCEECVLFDENGNDNDIDSNETMEKSSSSCEVPDAFYEKEPPLRP